MILTKCAVCATELELTLGKKCGRCSTRYCGPACQKQHWQEFGHDQLCKRIKKEGGAEQYNANTRYTAAVSIAAEACAEDTKGQTCHICTQALHWKTKEGLVRMCGCSGTSGFAHVSCLEEQAKILVAEAEENNKDPQWHRWHKCGLCEQDYYGIVRCALGWACWKTYLGRPETDDVRGMAMTNLGNGLLEARQHEDALIVREADLATKLRIGAPEGSILVAQANRAGTYAALGRGDEALSIYREAYAGCKAILGNCDQRTIMAANNLVHELQRQMKHTEAVSILRGPLSDARRAFGDDHEMTLMLGSLLADSLVGAGTNPTVNDVREAIAIREDICRRSRRLLGVSHPHTEKRQRALDSARSALANHESAGQLRA